MLIDLEILDSEIERCKKFIKENKFKYTLEQLYPLLNKQEYHPSTGIYISEGTEFPKHLFKQQPKKWDYNEKYILVNGKLEYNPNYLDMPYFGTCDNPDQVLKKYGKYLEDKNHKYFLFFTKVYQEPGIPRGFSWHKNGKYIGNLKPCHEYLNDENFGESFQGYIMAFDIYKIL